MDKKEFELDDMQLDDVVGGMGSESVPAGRNTVKRVCEVCGVEREFRIGSGGRGYCMHCNHMQLV